MSVLHNFDTNKNIQQRELKPSEIFCVFYHDIFDYPLTFSELIKWSTKPINNLNLKVDYKNGYYFIKGRDRLVFKRLMRKRYSEKKMIIAKKAARVLALIPSIKMVGITGSLSMNNADKNSDIDFFIITKKGKLWSTRIISYLFLKIANFKIRIPKDVKQKDRLCLNMWLDESDLVWEKKYRNIYTAHEILQIKPLINRKPIFENFISQNKWVFDYWPSVMSKEKIRYSYKHSNITRLGFIEKLLYKLQLMYMKPKITSEKITITRAIFHPTDLSAEILKKMGLT